MLDEGAHTGLLPVALLLTIRQRFPPMCTIEDAAELPCFSQHRLPFFRVVRLVGKDRFLLPVQERIELAPVMNVR